MNKFILYCHKNNINGKVYIGISSNHKKRFVGNGIAYKGCPIFYNAIKKYGLDNFEHIILHENLSKEEACKLEIETIDKYNSTNRKYGYNVSNGGDAFRLGFRYSEEEKIEMSIKRKGINKGKRCSIKSEYKIGHGFSEEILLKMSEAKKGKPTWNKGLKYTAIEGDKNPMKRPEIVAKFIGANNVAAKSIYLIDENNNEIKKYDCLSDAARELNVNVSNITACCKGRLKSTKGYKFKYAS